MCAALALALAVTPTGWAQTDHSTVIRVLQQGRDFRARVRAALALGSSNDRSVVPHLVQALSDRNAAVRAASATALGRLQDPAAIEPLRRLSRDRRRAVRNEAERAIRRIVAANRQAAPSRQATNRRAPARSRDRSAGRERYPSIAVVPRARSIHWPRVRYVVVLGSMENRSNFTDDRLSEVLVREVRRHLTVLRGVAVLREGHEPPDAEQQIRRRRLPKLRLEGAVNRVDRQAQRRQVSVRCEVSLMVLEEPGRNIRSVLNGAATGRSPRRGRRSEQERELAEQAVTGAVRSAMRGAAQAITSAGRR